MAIGRNPRQRFWLVFAVFGACSFATGCHWLPPLGSINAPYSPRRSVMRRRIWEGSSPDGTRDHLLCRGVVNARSGCDSSMQLSIEEVQGDPAGSGVQAKRAYPATRCRASGQWDPRERRLPRMDCDRHGRPGQPAVEVGAARVLWAVLLADDGPTGGFFAMGGSFPGELAAGSEVSTESTTRSVGRACSRMSLDESPSPVRDRRRIYASGSRRCRSPPDEPCRETTRSARRTL